MGLFDPLKEKKANERAAEIDESTGCASSMSGILCEIRKIVDKNMAVYLPHVKNSDLEKNGAIFYMNGNNGTEFDWYVNDRLPYFMVFYNDKENLGAVKLALYNDGEVELYLYDEKGKKLIQTVNAHMDIKDTDMLQLAVAFTQEADDKSIWDGDMESINVDMEIHDDALGAFQSRQGNYTVMKNRMKILQLRACVSKEIIEEGWKVGYMERTEPHDQDDSGWVFVSGNEGDAYLSDPNHFMLLNVGMVWQRLDRDIFPYIDSPIGTKLIRISPDDFEIDQNDKEIYTVKRNA